MGFFQDLKSDLSTAVNEDKSAQAARPKAQSPKRVYLFII